MLHNPSAGVGVAYSGTVQYTLAPMANDSIIVALSIIPSAGGNALYVDGSTRDIGLIAVNTNLPNAGRFIQLISRRQGPNPALTTSRG